MASDPLTGRTSLDAPMSQVVIRRASYLWYPLGAAILLVMGAGIVRVVRIDATLVPIVLACFLTFGATLIDRDLGIALFGLALGGLFTDAPFPGAQGASVASGAGLAFALISRGDRPASLLRERSSLFWIPVAIMALALVSWVANGSPSTSIAQWLIPMAQRISIVAVILLFCESSRSRRVFVVVALLIPTVIQASFGVLQSIGYLPTIHATWIEGEAITRVGGLEGDPNYLGLGLVMGIAFALGFLRNRLHMLLSLCALALATIALGFTLSRGGLVALMGVGMGAVLGGRTRSKRKTLGSIVALMLVAGILFYSAPSAFFQRFEEVSGSSDPTSGGSAAQHLGLARGAISLTLASPLIGVGPDQTRYRIGAAAPYALDEQSAHNTFLDMAADLGLPGLLLWLALLFQAVRFVRRSLRESAGSDLGIAYGCWLALIAFIVGSLFLTAGLSNGFWVTLALIGSFPNPPHPDPPQGVTPHQRDPW